MAATGAREDAPQGGMPLGPQVVRGSVYGIASSAVTLVLGFSRAVLLARLLLPEHFGVFTLAMFYIGLAGQLRTLGLDQALIHRQDAEDAVFSTYFAMRVGLDLVATILLIALAPLLQLAYPAMPGLGRILSMLALVFLLSNLDLAQETLLQKELAFGPLAITDVSASLAMTLIAVYVAWRGWGVWALVAEQASGILARFLLAWGPFRRWTPRWKWDADTARWFWEYGKSMWLFSNLGYLLDHFDDFWVGTALGEVALGFYGKAYDFALYPRRVFANPLVNVFTPVFARLQHDRLRLSQAFFRAAHLILRTGLLIAGGFALVMPEFITAVIGTKWMPMLWTFRLMLIYTALDPLLLLVGALFLAVGRPDALRKSAIVQVLFFVPAVIVGAALWGINGVALAADGMLLVGAAQRYQFLREQVDFSLARLTFWPLITLAVAWGTALAVELLWRGPDPLMLASIKLGLFGVLYVGLLTAVEGKDYIRALRWLWANLTGKKQASAW